MTTTNQPTTLMDLCADGLIPEPSAQALELVGLSPDADCSAPWEKAQLLIAAAMTICQEETRDDPEAVKVTGFAVNDLQSASNMATAALTLGR